MDSFIFNIGLKIGNFIYRFALKRKDCIIGGNWKRLLWSFYISKVLLNKDEIGGYIVPEVWRTERRRMLKIEVKRLNLMGFIKEARRLEKRLEKEDIK